MDARKRFVKDLEELAGEEDLVFVLPYPLLPPRFLKNSKQRNLLLCIDTDICVSTRWEGARLSEWSPLTPRAAYRLINDVLQRMRGYAADGFALAAFLSENGCVNDSSPGQDDASSRRPDVVPQLLETQREKTTEKRALCASTKIPEDSFELGGESPFPNWEF